MTGSFRVIQAVHKRFRKKALRVAGICFGGILTACTPVPGDQTGSSLQVTGRTIHVSSVAGSNRNSGTEERPLKDISRAVAMARPGDTILLAPGVFRISSRSAFQGVYIRRSGRKNAPITLTSAGGGATIDCSGMQSRTVVYCLQLEANYWRISNISVTGARQNADKSWAVGIQIENGSFNVLDSVRSFGNQGPGILVTGNSRGNRIENCVSYSNYDPRSSTPGANADGIQVAKIPRRAVGNVIRNCRSYNNSDDGFDLWGAEAPVTIENSLAQRNGYVPGTRIPAGDGAGFKLGENSSGPLHLIRSNRAEGNRGFGFNSNNASASAILVGNSASGNGAGSFR